MHKSTQTFLGVCYSFPPQLNEQLSATPACICSGPRLSLSLRGVMYSAVDEDSEKRTFPCFPFNLSSLVKAVRSHPFLCLWLLPPTPFVFGAERHSAISSLKGGFFVLFCFNTFVNLHLVKRSVQPLSTCL